MSSTWAFRLARSRIATSSGSPPRNGSRGRRASLVAVKVEAAKYVPAEVKGVEVSLDAAKASLAKGDYQAALTAAQALPAQISALQTAVAAKKTELMQKWAKLSAGLPQVVQAIQSRVDILSKAKKLPAGLDQAKFESAKSGLATITQAWGAATAAAGTDDLGDAVSNANAVKSKAVEVLTTLGMPVPPALQ